MSFSPGPGAYGPPGMPPPGYWQQGNRPPGTPGRRDGTTAIFVRLTAPILLLVLGLTGFFLGFAPAGRYGGYGREPYSMFDGYLMMFPVLVLIAGLIGIAGLIPGERPQLWLTTAISGATAATMLCLLPSFADDESSSWGYWVVFTIILAQMGVALFAIFIGSGLITVTAQHPGPPGSWPGPNYGGPPSSPLPPRGPQMQPPPPSSNPQVPPPGQG